MYTGRVRLGLLVNGRGGERGHRGAATRKGFD